jgi:hypothetical protein
MKNISLLHDLESWKDEFLQTRSLKKSLFFRLIELIFLLTIVSIAYSNTENDITLLITVLVGAFIAIGLNSVIFLSAGKQAINQNSVIASEAELSLQIQVSNNTVNTQKETFFEKKNLDKNKSIHSGYVTIGFLTGFMIGWISFQSFWLALIFALVVAVLINDIRSILSRTIIIGFSAVFILGTCFIMLSSFNSNYDMANNSAMNSNLTVANSLPMNSYPKPAEQRMTDIPGVVHSIRKINGLEITINSSRVIAYSVVLFEFTIRNKTSRLKELYFPDRGKADKIYSRMISNDGRVFDKYFFILEENITKSLVKIPPGESANVGLVFRGVPNNLNSIKSLELVVREGKLKPAKVIFENIDPLIELRNR